MNVSVAKKITHQYQLTYAGHLYRVIDNIFIYFRIVITDLFLSLVNLE